MNEGSKGVLARARRAGPRRCRASSAGDAPAGRAEAARLLRRAASASRGPPRRRTGTPPRASPRDPAFAGWPLVVLVDDAAARREATRDLPLATFTRFEPGGRRPRREADARARNQIVRSAPIVLDARMKPWIPALVGDPATAALVDRRWREYFPGGDVEMGDSALAHLAPG